MTTPARRVAARKIVRNLQKQAGYPNPRLPPIAELLELGEAYLAEVGVGDGVGRTLGESGQVYVTLAAAQAYGAMERLGDEEARRELTEILLASKEIMGRSRLWRARRRSTGLDLIARVSHENQLLVVTSVDVRPLNNGGRRG